MSIDQLAQIISAAWGAGGGVALVSVVLGVLIGRWGWSGRGEEEIAAIHAAELRDAEQSADFFRNAGHDRAMEAADLRKLLQDRDALFSRVRIALGGTQPWDEEKLVRRAKESEGKLRALQVQQARAREIVGCLFGAGFLGRLKQLVATEQYYEQVSDKLGATGMFRLSIGASLGIAKESFTWTDVEDEVEEQKRLVAALRKTVDDERRHHKVKEETLEERLRAANEGNRMAVEALLGTKTPMTWEMLARDIKRTVEILESKDALLAGYTEEILRLREGDFDPGHKMLYDSLAGHRERCRAIEAERLERDKAELASLQDWRDRVCGVIARAQDASGILRALRDEVQA